MMIEVLKAEGWVMYHQCNSCGGLTQWWNHKDKRGYVIKTRPKKNTFKIVLNNNTIAGPLQAYQLSEKLRQYVN